MLPDSRFWAENAQSTFIQVSNPWQGAKDVTMSIFISRNGEQAPGFNGPTIPAGAKRIVCMASSYIAMLDALGSNGQNCRSIGHRLRIQSLYSRAHKNSIKGHGPRNEL